MRHNGAWTRHEFDVAVSEWAAAYDDHRFYLTVDGDETHKPIFYRSEFANDVPIHDGEFAAVGDGTTTPFDAWVEFPELWQEDGSLARPMHVLVEFTSYDTGASLDAHFGVEVDVIDRFGQETVNTLIAGEWDESDAIVASTADGVRRRYIARNIPASSPGAGLQVRLTDIRGVKIERVVLDFELSGSLDRA
jgi:hypothetical protein